MSLHINRAVASNLFAPVKICKNIKLSHSLFVDDVLIFAMLSLSTWTCFKTILDRFHRATGLTMNKAKTFLYYNDADDSISSQIAQIFDITYRPLSEGLKYLDFSLKCRSYKSEDWRWIVDRFHKKLADWSHRTLSLGGRVILVKSVLTQLSVFWGHLFLLPPCIISSINRIISCFIWGAKADCYKLHLSKLDSLSLPKIFDGWGILNIKIFGTALICKSLWRGVYGSSIWSDIVRQKYLKGRGIEYWYRFQSIGSKRGSAIWSSFRKVQGYFLGNLKWNIHTGSKIFIGIDSFAGFKGTLQLSPPLLFFLRRLGLYTWEQLVKEWDGSQPVLRDAEDINLPLDLIPLWSDLSISLRQGGLLRSNVADHLTWSLPFSAPHAIVKDIYSFRVGF